MNSKKARQLRREAKAAAEVPYGTTNINIDVKSKQSGKVVMSEEGKYVQEMVPVVTYTATVDEGSARFIYKELKKGETNA